MQEVAEYILVTSKSMASYTACYILGFWTCPSGDHISKLHKHKLKPKSWKLVFDG